MELNADFSRRASAHADQMPWVASPMAGVERRMLDRVGGEVARATSIVRYAPGSRFSPHVHEGGEEFIVLEGVFQDEHGDFPTGTYVRNPPTSKHIPRSDAGCTIFVKLWQFDPGDRQHICIDTNGVTGPLFKDAHEEVSVEDWAPDARVEIDASGGAELLVLGGGFTEGGETFGRHDWLRLPAGARSHAEAGPEGARVWIKRGHLRQVRNALGPKV